MQNASAWHLLIVPSIFPHTYSLPLSPSLSLSVVTWLIECLTNCLTDWPTDHPAWSQSRAFKRDPIVGPNFCDSALAKYWYRTWVVVGSRKCWANGAAITIDTRTHTYIHLFTYLHRRGQGCLGRGQDNRGLEGLTDKCKLPGTRCVCVIWYPCKMHAIDISVVRSTGHLWQNSPRNCSYPI